MLLSIIVCLAMLPFQGEFPICEADGSQGVPAIAWGSSNYLVVWMDYPISEYDIWGRIVNSDGSFIDTCFAICPANGDQEFPQLAWDGAKYLVVWENWGKVISGQFISPNGTLIDTNFTISGSTIYNRYRPSLTWDGDKYLAVWMDARTGKAQIWGQFVDSTGALIDTNFAIFTDPESQDFPDIIWNGTNYFLTWSLWYGVPVQSEIRGLFLNSNGIPQGSDFLISFSIPDTTTPFRPAIAYSGTNHLVIWDHSNNGNYDIWGQIVDTSGALTDSNFPISTADNYQTYPQVTCGATKYLAVWWDTRSGPSNSDIWGQFITMDGVLADTNFPVCMASNNQWGPDADWDGSRFLVVWHDCRNSPNPDIWGKFIEEPPGIEDVPGEHEKGESLQQNYPNPFSITTSITFTLPSAQEHKSTGY